MAAKNIDIGKIDRVLVIKLRHIGDVLLVTPTLRALKNAKASLEVSALVYRGTEEMLELNPCLDHVWALPKGKGFLRQLYFLQKLRAQRYDLVVNMTEGDRGALVAFMSGARYRIGIDPCGRGFIGKRLLFTHLIDPVGNGRHRAVMDMDVLKPLGIEPAESTVELFTSEADDSYVERLLLQLGVTRRTPFAVVHPTSRWLFKCWRDEGVARVIDHVEAMGIRVVATCGPDEREKEKLESILSLCSSNPLALSGVLGLKQLASLFKKAVFFFGVDTAPMHMAAALGKPVLALFGPSDFRVWGPLSPKAAIIARTAEFPCIPCRRDGCGGSKRSRCLEAISEDEVIEVLDSWYRSLSPAAHLPGSPL